MTNLKSISKRGLALFLALVMCLSTVNLTALAAEEAPETPEPSDGVYICGLEEHTHTEACYESEAQAPSEPAGEPDAATEDENEDEEPAEAPPAAQPDAPAEEETEQPPVQTPEEAPALTPGESADDASAPPAGETPDQDPAQPAGGEADTPAEPAPETAADNEVIPETDDAEQAEAGTEGEITGIFDAPLTAGEPAETEPEAESAGDNREPVCGREEHTHTLMGCTVFPELAAGLEEFGPRLEAFRGTYFENLTEEDYDEYGGLTEEAMTAFTEAAAAELGEACNALIELYRQIPARFAEDAAYQETAATLENLAGILGGDLDGGVMVLANRTILCDKTDISGETYFERHDGSHTITLTGGYEWKGRLEFGGAHTVTIKGNGTIDAYGTGSAITVNPGCTVILEGNVTVKGGTGSYVDPWGKGTAAAHTVGGGVCVKASKTAGGTFIMRADENGNAPTICDNSAGAGGGIYVGSFSWDDSQTNANLYIYAGRISSNTATADIRYDGNSPRGYDGGGGGLWINGKAEIDPTADRGGSIEIKNNVSKTQVDLGGGGIYVNNPGSLSLKNAVITQNEAQGLGGGVASCVHSRVGIVNIGNNGAAIYSNRASTKNGQSCTTAYDKNEAGTSSSYWNYGLTGHEGSIGNFVDAYTKWQNNNAFKKAAQDIFCAGAAANGGGTIISDTRPMDSSAGWTGYAMDTVNSSFRQITRANNGYIYGGFLLGLTAGNTTPPGFDRVVTISGNKSATHGGGVATNGILTMSYVHTASREVNSYSLNGAVPLNVSKTLTGADLSKNSFTFELVDGSGKVLDTAATNAQGRLELDYGDGIDQTKAIQPSYTFYVRERANNNTQPNPTTYKVTVTTQFVETKTHTAANVTVHEHYYKVNGVTMEKGTGIGGDFVKSASAVGISYTNTWKTGSLTIRKTVSNPALAKAGNSFTFTVTLKDDSGKGIAFDKNGTYGGVKFTNGSASVTLTVKDDGTVDSRTITDLPAGLTYAVQETGQTGWTQVGVTGGNGTISASGATAAFTNRRDVTNLTVKKTVSVGENSASRPADDAKYTIKVQLGNDKVTDRGTGTTEWKGEGVYTFELASGDTATIAEIPTNTTYMVTEEGLGEGWSNNVPSTGFTGTASGQTVTVENHYYKPQYTSVAVEKAFVGGDSYKPESVTVKLEGGPATLTEAERTITLPHEGKWSYTWEKLDKFPDEKGAAYTYSVKEVSASYPALTAGQTGLVADDRADGSNIIRVRNTANEVKKDDGSGTGIYEIVGGWNVSEGSAVAGGGEIKITNTWRGADEVLNGTAFIIQKIDSETKKPIAGVEFILTDAEGKELKQTTGATGEVIFESLTVGTYTLREYAPAEGYLDHRDEHDAIITWQVEVKKDQLVSVEEIGDKDTAGEVGVNTWSLKATHDGEATLTVENTIRRGSIQITKNIDFTGNDWGKTEDFAGKTFRFKVVDASGKQVEGSPVTVEAGKTATISGLRYDGTYTITEVEPDAVLNYTWNGVKFNGTADSITVTVKDAINSGKPVEVTAVNTYERQLSSLAVTKTVSCDQTTSNAPVPQSFTIRVKLGGSDAVVAQSIFADDGLRRTTYLEDGVYVITLSAGETATIHDIPAGTEYTVTEEDVPEWAQDAAGYTCKGITNAKAVLQPNEAAEAEVRNHYFNVKRGTASITKAWDYENQTNADGSKIVLPEKVAVQLYQKADGGKAAAYGEPVELTEATGWKAEWSELPLYDGDQGAAYTYTVEEVSVAYPKLAENETGLQADVLQDGLIRVRNTANKTEDGTAEIVGGWLVSEGGSFSVSGNSLTLKNTWLPAEELGSTSFTVHKVDSEYTGADGETELAIPGVTFTLTKLGNGVPDDETAPREVKTDENGDATFRCLTDGKYILEETGVASGYRTDGSREHPVNLHRTWEIEIVKDGLASVKEMAEADGYAGENTWNWKPSVQGIVDGENHTGTLTVTNEIIKGQISIQKVLDLDGVNPGNEAFANVSYTFDIYAGRDTSDRSAVVDTLTVYANGGQVLSKPLRYGVYTIRESAATGLADYKWTGVTFQNGADSIEVEVTEQDETYGVTATNHYTRDTGDISVSKTVTGNRGDRERAWTFDVTLTAPASYVKLDGKTFDASVLTETVNPDGTVTASAETTQITLVTPLDAAVRNARAAWDAAQLRLPEEQRAAFDEAAFRAGHAGEYPDTVDGKDVRVAVLTLTHGQTATLQGLPAGTAYTVAEAEANTDGYSTTAKDEAGTVTTAGAPAASFENYNNYNRPTTVNLSVRKVWAGDEAASRPASVTMVLYRDGEEYDRVELTAETNWRHSWNSLERAAEWTLEEADVPAGYTSAVTQEGVTFTVTNTYSGTDIPEEHVPLTDIPDGDVPLAELPDDDVPLAELPDGEVPLTELPDEEIPLAEVPRTGEAMYGWYLVTALAAAGFVSLQVVARRKREKQDS